MNSVERVVDAQMAMLQFGYDVLLRHGVHRRRIAPILESAQRVDLVVLEPGSGLPTVAYSVYLTSSNHAGLLVMGISAEFHGEWEYLNSMLRL